MSNYHDKLTTLDALLDDVAHNDPREVLELATEVCNETESRGGRKVVARNTTYNDRYSSVCTSGWQQQQCVEVVYSDGTSFTRCGSWHCEG